METKTIQIHNPNTLIGKTVKFKPNNYTYYQDFKFKTGIPAIEFKIVDVMNNMDFKLVPDGYGELNDAIYYVERNIVFETMLVNIMDDKPEKLNIPFILRWLIILGSSILIILIWLCMIPFWIFVTLPTGRFMHEFDFVMQPYYWLTSCYKNEKFD